jgi:hypothetical protein
MNISVSSYSPSNYSNTDGSDYKEASDTIMKDIEILEAEIFTQEIEEGNQAMISEIKSHEIR